MGISVRELIKCIDRNNEAQKHSTLGREEKRGFRVYNKLDFFDSVCLLVCVSLYVSFSVDVCFHQISLSLWMSVQIEEELISAKKRSKMQKAIPDVEWVFECVLTIKLKERQSKQDEKVCKIVGIERRTFD